MNELVKSEHTIEFSAKRPIKLGQVFYAVENYDHKHFYGKCPVCNGEQLVHINGFEFSCPKCAGGKYPDSPVLTVTRYTVRRYRVKSIKEELWIYDWNPSEGFKSSVEIEFYRPIPRCSSDWTDHRSMSFTIKSDADNRLILKNCYGELFSNYQSAVAKADELNVRQEMLVKQYNESYGTDFVFEKPTYDKKSR